MSSNNLTKEKFYSNLVSCPESDKYWIACSSGMDSCVLLHLFYSNRSKIKQSIEVIYVDHRLQEQSKAWGDFCDELCQQYGFPFTRLEIEEECKNNSNIEEWAREKRYELLAKKIKPKDILFTAHHQDDQVETFFLHALRGSGPRGLVAMPAIRGFSKGFHARPLLNFPHKELDRYACENKLIWKDDPSNKDMRYDRNYLRNSVLSIVEGRWPAYRKTISRLIQHQLEIKLLLDEIADEDLNKVSVDNTSAIDLDSIHDLSDARIKNLIAYWLKKLQLNPPASRHLNQIINDVISSGKDKVPCVNWKGVEVTRYRNRLYAFNSLSELDKSVHLEWDINKPFELSGESLISSSSTGKGILKKYIKNEMVEIRYRQGGEKIRPENQLISKSVKHLFQERGVLPWYRDRIPLIYINEELALIPGFCVDEKFCAKNNEASWDINWTGYDKVIQK